MESYIWLIIILVLSVIEFMTVSLVTIWFVISAAVALILSFFIDSIFILFAVFVLLGVVLLIFTKPLMDKYVKPSVVCTNSDRVIGMKGIVTQKIDDCVGEVKVDGKLWSAISDDVFPAGCKVLIEDIKGVKLIVKGIDVK